MRNGRPIRASSGRPLAERADQGGSRQREQTWIADHISAGCLLLCNESFASTNEREGSEITRQVVTALLEAGVKVLFVTHMFDLASGFHQRGLPNALFLRAERGADGARPFRISVGEPLPTSYGEDSYRKDYGKPIDRMPVPGQRKRDARQ